MMAGVVGDDDAIMNYGMYSRSNHAHGFGIYKHMFIQYRSIIPEFVRLHMPNYPKFASNAVSIEQGRTTHLMGSHSIRKLRLVHAEKPKAIVTINLASETPVAIIPTHREDTMDDEDFWV